MSADKNDSKEEKLSIKGIIKASLDDFQGINKEAYGILISHNDEGFFESKQTPKPLKELANQLLGTISGDDTSDEN